LRKWLVRQGDLIDIIIVAAYNLKDRGDTLNDEIITIGEAIAQYLATLKVDEKQARQQDLNRFVRWCGAKRELLSIKIRELDNYGEHVSDQNDPLQKLQPVKAFFAYLKKIKVTEANLGVHLRVKRSNKKRPLKTSSKKEKTITLTRQGLEEHKVELEKLIAERPAIAKSINLAAADKDFKENAPLDAAKDHQGQVEARIRELEAIIKLGVVADEGKSDNKIKLGAVVTLFDITHSEQLCYTLVGPSEANLAKSKLSVESPIGKAIVGRTKGKVVQVKAPMGKIEYRIEEIG
jgi:transcription elongation factor GreA